MYDNINHMKQTCLYYSKIKSTILILKLQSSISDQKYLLRANQNNTCYADKARKIKRIYYACTITKEASIHATGLCSWIINNKLM